MTRVTYNGIELGLVRTIKVEQRAKMDPSNTDQLYIAHRFHVRAVMTKPNGFEVPPAVQGTDNRPADTMARVRSALLRPRRTFKYEALDQGVGGGTTLLEVTGDTDADNGPKPVSCDIVQVTEATWIVEYIIDVAAPGCGAGFRQFASNRYETTQDIDHRGYSTITTLGKVIVTSDMKKSPDVLRPIITPPMPAGFRRKAMYQVTEDGLAMNYKIVDTEMFLAPPKNAVEARGRFSVTAVPPGAIMWAQVDIHLEGKKDQPKRQLMETAVLIALRRLEKAGVMRNPVNQRPFVQGGSMSEELWDNVVEVSLRAQINMSTHLAAPNDQFNAAKGFWKGFTYSLFGIPGIVAGLIDAGKQSSAWRGNSGGIVGGGTAGLEQNRGANDKLRGDAKRAADAAGGAQGGDPSKAPTMPGATVTGGLLDRFGTDLVGVHQTGVVDPGLRGNLPFLALVAAAFRDPCVFDAIGNLKANNNEESALRSPSAKGPRPAIPGERAGRAVEVASRAEENAIWNVQEVAWSRAQAVQMLVASQPPYSGIPGPVGSAADEALDWLRGRLMGIPENPPDPNVPVSLHPSGRLIAVVPALEEFPSPVPTEDDFPGWYESWYCEVGHDLDGNRDALAATVVGRAAKTVAWANPLRTIRVKWAATKAGFPPEVQVIAGDANVIILRHVMELPTVEVGTDGQTVRFSVSGETTYKALDEQYVEVHWPVPPWLNLPMRVTPAPIIEPTIVVTGGATGAAQDGLIARTRPGLLNNQPRG